VVNLGFNELPADSIDSMTIKGVLVTKQQIKEIYEYIKSKD
jgi:hypothetical protein